MREIKFYQTSSGYSPVETFLETLTGKQAQKVVWVLKLIEELKNVPPTYLKKLSNTDDIWEVRVQLGNNIFRLLGFFENETLLILTSGFAKKTQKTPLSEIRTAEKRKYDYLNRRDEDE